MSVNHPQKHTFRHCLFPLESSSNSCFVCSEALGFRRRNGVSAGVSKAVEELHIFNVE